jgi:hypothetical protein
VLFEPEDPWFTYISRGDPGLDGEEPRKTRVLSSIFRPLCTNRLEAKGEHALSVFWAKIKSKYTYPYRPVVFSEFFNVDLHALVGEAALQGMVR